MSKNRDLANYGTAALEDAEVSATAGSVVKRDASGNINAVNVYASGNLGVGTSSPQRNITINSSLPILQLTNPTAGTTGDDGLLIYQNGVNSVFSNQEAGSQSFETSGTERMKIDASGNVGIGVSSPGVKLSVANDGAGEADVARFSRTNGSDLGFLDIGINPDSNEVIYDGSGSAAMSHIFRTGGAERMRIDSSGNVGIGTTLINSTLSVGSTDSAATITSGGSNTHLQLKAMGSGGVLIFGAGGVANGTAGTERMRIDSSGNVGIGTSIPGSYRVAVEAPANLFSGYSTTHAAEISIKGTATNVLTIAGGTGDNIAFATNGSTETMRIDSSGNVLVGTTSTPSGKLTTVTSSGLWGLTVRDVANNQAGVQFINASSSQVGSIAINSSSTSYNTSSDYRLKEDWQPMDCACDRVMQLNPVNFAWKADGTRVDGFLAHELQEVVPEAVTGEKDETRIEEYEVEPAVYEDVVIPAEFDEEGNEISPERTEQKLVKEAVMGEREVPEYQGIDQAKLVPLLTAALQDAIKEIESLKARIEALEG